MIKKEQRNEGSKREEILQNIHQIKIKMIVYCVPLWSVLAFCKSLSYYVTRM